jgi:hypothetical protein
MKALKLITTFFVLLPFIAPVHADQDSQSQDCIDQVKMMGSESSFNFNVRNFIVPKAQCKDKKSVQAFCGFVQSYDGYKTLAEDAALLPDTSDPDYANMVHVRDRAAKVCGTTTEAIRAALCAKADASKQWKYAYAECPVEGKQIFMRECLKPHRFVGEGANGKMVQYTEAECTKQYESRSKSW